MVKIDYPPYDFRIKKEEGRDIIFDELRKSWVQLTPEEWVRQNFLQHLLQVKKYPSTLIAVEKEIRLNELKKRFDILVYNRSHQPWMMIECKSMDVELDPKVLQQVLRYNLAVPVEYVVITNGKHCFAARKAIGTLDFLEQMPEFS